LTDDTVAELEAAGKPYCILTGAGLVVALPPSPFGETDTDTCSSSRAEVKALLDEPAQRKDEALEFLRPRLLGHPVPSPVVLINGIDPLRPPP